MNAALELFAEKGYEGTTTREISELSGQHLYTISYHFSTKEQLYSAVIEYIIERIRLSNVVLTDSEVSTEMGFVQLMFIVNNMVQGSLSDAALPNSRIIMQEQYRPSENFAKLSKGIIEPIQNSIAAALANAVGKPELAQTHEFLIHSHLIHSLVLSYQTFRGTLKSRLDIQDIDDEMKLELIKHVSTEIEWIVNGLRQKYNSK